MPGRKRVAIIGAGLSGLAAVKSCIEEGLLPVCFEQYDSVGGVWYYTEDYRDGQGARAYTGLCSNTSKELMAFSDFPFPPDVSSFVPSSKVHEYALSYCDKFGLTEHVHLNTKVLKLRQSRDYDVTGSWELEIEENGKGVSSHVFDFVMVCCGYFKKARFPDVEGKDIFKGSIEHSMTFKDGTKYRNQRVLVVGNKHSAGDVSNAIAEYADQVYLSVGKGTWIMPKFIRRGIPSDFYLMRRCMFWNIRKLNRTVMELCNDRCDHTLHGICPSAPPTETCLMVNDDIQHKIMSGKVTIVGDLVRFGPREAEFRDGTIVHDIDAIVFATGYDLNLEFLNLDILAHQEKLNLYKMVFPVQVPQNTLAIIGCIDGQGSVPPALEMQARLASRVFAGNHQLPSRKTMGEDVDKWNKLLFARYGRYKYAVSNLPHRDGLAAELGAAPSWWDLIKAGPRLAYLYYYGPAFSYYHRLWGPHSWSGAREAIDKALTHGYYTKQLRVAPNSIPTRQGHFYLPFIMVSLVVVALLLKRFAI